MQNIMNPAFLSKPPSWMKKYMKIVHIINFYWLLPEEEWTPPGLLAEDRLCMNEYLSGIQMYGEKGAQLHSDTTVMGIMIIINYDILFSNLFIITYFTWLSMNIGMFALKYEYFEEYKSIHIDGDINLIQACLFICIPLCKNLPECMYTNMCLGKIKMSIHFCVWMQKHIF